MSVQRILRMVTMLLGPGIAQRSSASVRRRVVSINEAAGRTQSASRTNGLNSYETVWTLFSATNVLGPVASCSRRPANGVGPQGGARFGAAVAQTCAAWHLCGQRTVRDQQHWPGRRRAATCCVFSPLARALIGATGLIDLQGLDFAPDGTLYGWDITVGRSNRSGDRRCDRREPAVARLQTSVDRLWSRWHPHGAQRTVPRSTLQPGSQHSSVRVVTPASAASSLFPPEYRNPRRLHCSGSGSRGSR
jgi:hypothetical protein